METQSPTALHAAKLTISVVIYCVSVSAVPIYNKNVFDGTFGVKKFPFPIATAFLQLGCVALTCIILEVGRHLFPSRVQTEGKSWIFGPHFLYKMRHTAPVGLLFGIKYGITNWGLHLVPTSTHVLLQSTDLFWTVAFARIINKETLGFLDGLAALLCAAGSVLIGLRAGTELGNDAVLGLLVNLLTPVFLALCITTLRSGTKELFNPENRLRGSISTIEFTAFKLVFSSSMALILACILENGLLSLTDQSLEPWWTALAEYSAKGSGLILLGAVFILIFQVNITWLAGLTSATTVGIVGGVKVVPQWFFNALFNLKVDVSPLNIAGATLTIASSILYATVVSYGKRLLLTQTGFQWEQRSASTEEEAVKYPLAADVETTEKPEDV